MTHILLTGAGFSRSSNVDVTIIHVSSLLLSSQISTPARLIFVTHRDDSPAIPARRGRQPVTLVGGVGAAPAGSASSAGPPGASGDTARPNYVGPSGNGLVERMKAGA